MPRRLATPERQPLKSQIPNATLAIVLYIKADERFIELFDVQAQRLVNPRRLDKSALQQLHQVIQQEQRAQQVFNGSVDAHILWLEPTRMAFFVPAHVRKLHLARKGEQSSVRTVYIPDSVVIYSGPAHDVHYYWVDGTVMGRGKVLDPCGLIRTGKRVLTPAPLPNINPLGSLCIGTSFNRAQFKPDPLQMREHVLTHLFGGLFTEWRTERVGPLLKHAEQAATYLTERQRYMYFWHTKHSHLVEHLHQCPPQALLRWLTPSMSRTP